MVLEVMLHAIKGERNTNPATNPELNGDLPARCAAVVMAQVCGSNQP